MKVIKRDGRAVEYNSEKICVAINKANQEVLESERATLDEMSQITKYIESLNKKRILVEDIQDIIEQKLMEIGRYELAKKYIVYRYTRALVRKQNTTDETILGFIKNSSLIPTHNTNVTVAVQRNLIAGEVSKDLTKRILLPEKITKAHENGIIHFHATDYFLQPIINSCYVNLGEMLNNGTYINNQEIETPKSFHVACIIITQIIATISSSQYGEQYVNMKHLGKYLRASYNKIKDELNGLNEKTLSEDVIEKITMKRLQNELSAGIQTIDCQINTLITNYGKLPNVSLILELNENDEYMDENIAIVREFLKQRMEKIEKNNLEGIQFPKIIFCGKCNDEELQNLIEKYCYKVCLKEMDKFKIEGQFNQGIVSINLPQVAKVSEGIEEVFWKELDERLEICFDALMCRHYALLGTVSNLSPIHWQSGAIARLEPGERIDKYLKDGYSSITMGYYGLKETIAYIAEKQKNSLDSCKFENKVIKYLDDKVLSWRKMTGIGFIIEEDIDNEACERLEKINNEMGNF